MTIKVDLSNLKKLENNLKRASKPQRVPVNDLLNTAFMRKYTKFASFEAMVSSSPFDIKNEKDFESVPGDQWDQFIQANSRFKNWQEMLNQAGAEHLSAKLLKDLK